MKKNWFRDAKYGLFIHFGLFSLLAGEYEGKEVPGLAEWIMNYADIPVERYRELAKDFDPVHFDAKWIAQSAKRWGMKYLCFTSKHHDGFALFDSKASDYNSVKASPCRRDFVAELAEACREEGIVFCLYYSQAQDWDDPDGYSAYHDNSQKNFRRYLDEKCLPQIRELLTQYGEIGMLWFDTPMGMSKEESAEIVELVKSLQPNCLISGRIGNQLGDYLTTQDNRIPSQAIEGDWEVPATLNHSWGFKRSDEDWHSPALVLTKLLRIVSRGGNYLLNIGPDGTGVTPPKSVEILERVGSWFEKAGESLYGTRALPLYVYEAPELCFTHKPGTLYLHVLNPQAYAGQEIPLPNIANKVKKATWLNHGEEADLRVGNTLEGDPYWGLRMPEEIQEDLALCLKVETEEVDFIQLPL